MTTRETTSLLARPDHLDETVQSFSDKVAVAAYGAIQWPWLLRSLHGGRLSDKVALLDRLGLPHDALPNLGSWKADTALLTHIVNSIEMLRPAQVVELGCGASTLITARSLALFGGGQLTSYDQHGDFAEATRGWIGEHGLSADIRHAPLGTAPDGWPGSWYQLDAIPPKIDLLIIDGPPWSIHPHVRGAAERLFPYVAPGGMVLLDDASRPGERVVARRWRRRWPDFTFTLDSHGAKGTLIGIRHR